MVDTLARWELGAEELEKLEELGSKGGVGFEFWSYFQGAGCVL